MELIANFSVLCFKEMELFQNSIIWEYYNENKNAKTVWR